MKFNLKHVLLGFSIALMAACGKDEDSATPALTNVDLTGLYTGTITQSNARTAAGDDQFEIRLKSGRTYIFAQLYDGLKVDFFEATVTGKDFTGTGIAPFEDFTNLKGNLAGDEINFTFINADTNYSYTGIRPSTGGGSSGGNGFAGPAEYESGSMTLEVDGKTFTLSSIDDCALDSGKMFIDASASVDGYIELLSIDGISGPGTYNLTGFRWSDSRFSLDDEQAVLNDAVVISSISATSAVGTISFAYDGKSFSGTFNLTK